MSHLEKDQIGQLLQIIAIANPIIPEGMTKIVNLLS
jgi:hypothetical protein